MHDVVVVGAGPAGNLAARSLAERKFEVLVIEEHDSSGLPQHCTGLISDETIAMSRVRPDIYNTLYGAEVIFPNGQSIEVRSDKPKARIVDRVDMEMKMAAAAIDAGADYCYNEKYKSHVIGDAVVVDTDVRPHRGKILIGADGASSTIAMSLGDNRPREYVRGIQADVKYKMENQDLFRVFLGNSIAPGFFAWEIPCGSFTRIGLCTSWSAGAPSQYLIDLLIRLGLEDKVIKVTSGKIPLGGRQFVCGDRCILTGDAAGFVKPISGGGLYPTFRANRHLTDVLAAGLDSDAVYTRDLSDYERACNEDFGRDLDRGYRLRKAFVKLTDPDLNKVYDYIQKNDLVPILNDFNIDHPSETFTRIVRSPHALLSALPLVLRTI